MTLKEAVSKWQLDCTIIAVDDDDKYITWAWDVNAGYQQWGYDGYKTPNEARDAMITFLNTFEGPTK